MNEVNQLVTSHWKEVLTFLLVLGRTSGMVISAPFWGGATVPALVRVVIIVSLSITVYPFAQIFAAASGQGALSIVSLLVALGREVLIGLAVGWSAQLMFAGMRLAGQQMEIKMGLGLTQLVDPHEGGHTSLLPVLLDLVAALVFLSVNGHHLLIKALTSSYRLFPLSGETFMASGPGHTMSASSTGVVQSGVGMSSSAYALVEAAGGIFPIALQLSAPVVIGLLLSDVILGIVSRAVPQINLFVVILPVQFGFGVMLLLVSLPLLIWFYADQISVLSAQLLSAFLPSTAQ